ncbi:hypothetical protein Dimus_000389, partial [Dionaea muscipula]
TPSALTTKLTFPLLAHEGVEENRAPPVPTKLSVLLWFSEAGGGDGLVQPAKLLNELRMEAIVGQWPGFRSLLLGCKWK